MAKRRTVRKVDTEELQGEGSYVVITAVKVKEIRKTRKLSQDFEANQKAAEKALAAGETPEEFEDFDGFASGLEMIQNHVKDWNWVDDNDVPLPQLKTNPEVVNELSTDEVTFLAELLTGEEESKN